MKGKRFLKIGGILLLVYCMSVIYRVVDIKHLHNGQNHLSNKENPQKNYYFTFGHVKEKKAIALDSNKVFVLDYGKIKSLNLEKGKQYNPVTISLNALRALQRYQEDFLPVDSAVFMANASWLVENQKYDGSWSFNHNVEVGEYNLAAPWCSALSQGLGMSVLCRASQLVQDADYLVAAQKARLPLKKTIDQGGLTSVAGEGIFFEEYPVGDSGSHVLNGHIYALFGLHDLWLFNKDYEALALFQQGLSGLENYLPHFDAGHWSRYSISGASKLTNHYHLSSPWYQKLHSVQLQSLSEMTGNEIFQEYASRFRNQHENSLTAWLIYPSYIVYLDLVEIVHQFS